ncbi:ABC transporter permease [Roseicyclus sp. F158]|uniref:ABC transporter permease n=1 Tax=Tropicimonas omnivorans TaxID=3075590 RepID=A0ABU3DN25_9RHOB|nr:ABC transporter permease [Roseicyclus sp. F158]MDT0684477.1 ABC transporter permease [Roseicyclus sp. F158]
MNGPFLLRKGARCLMTLLLAVTFVFVVLRLSGDPVQRMLADDVPAKVIESYRVMWGLDRPLPEQYLRYIANVVRGDFGLSFRDDRAVATILAERIPATLKLGLLALGITLLIGIPGGIVAALNRGKLVDRVVMGITILGHSLPNFFLGILLILYFSMTLRLLPSSGIGTWQHMVMPAITLGTSFAGTVARFTRSAMLEVLNQPYMRTARAKGVQRPARIWHHALPNAAIPVVTVVGLRLGGLVGGATVVETVFGYPGIGSLLVNSVAQRDLAVVQGVVLLIAFTMVVTNLLIDLAYGWLDPRIAATQSGAGA